MNIRATKRIKVITVLFTLIFLMTSGFTSAEETEDFKPYFVSAKAGKMNVRTGPDKSYPIDWIYTAAGLPLEVTEVFGTWRKIKDWDGTEGWVTKSALSSKRRAFRTLTKTDLRRESDTASIVFARIEAGAVGKVLRCPETEPAVCLVEIQGRQGWLDKSNIWGVYADEVLD